VEPAVAHPAATVLLLRDGPAGVEVYLQRRPHRFGFAGGLWVFPGGRIDDSDRDPAVDAFWSGPSPETWAERLDVPVDAARGYVVGACRETLEEAGVLLADRALEPEQLETARCNVLSGARSFATVLADLDARLDTSRLRYWAWWRTPEGEPRRYDTRFFVAALPSDAVVRAHAGEVVDELWASAPTGEDLLPPTYYTLRDVTAFATTAEVLGLGRDRTVNRIQPVLDGDDILLPWGDRYRR
jgi:8-oxo-dGTP pyrophosphatase MutT (NUDIX family)